MIHAYARIHCDHPGCEATRELAEPLRFGQLNPLQTAELRAAAGALGWRAHWPTSPPCEGEGGGVASGGPVMTVKHYCPDHAPGRAFV